MQLTNPEPFLHSQIHLQDYRKDSYTLSLFLEDSVFGSHVLCVLSTKYYYEEFEYFRLIFAYFGFIIDTDNIGCGIRPF